MSTRLLETRACLIPTFTSLLLCSLAVAGPNDYTIDYAFGRITGEATLYTGLETTQILEDQFHTSSPVGPLMEFAHDTDGFGPFPLEERLVDATGWAVLQIDHPAPNPGYDFAITAQSEVLCNDGSTEGEVRSQTMVDFYVHGSLFLVMHVDAITITENIGSTIQWGRSLTNLDSAEVIFQESHEEPPADAQANSNTTTSFSVSVLHGGWYRAEVWALTAGTLRNSSSQLADAFALSRMNFSFSEDPPTAVYDVDEDGRIDGRDLALLLAGWGSSDERLDFNGDGVIDGADLGMLLGAWS